MTYQNQELAAKLKDFTAEAAAYDTLFPFKDSRVQLATSKIKTHFTALDQVLCGGLSEGSLTVLRAAPGEGKTTFATQLAKHFAAEGNLVTYYACEDSYLTLRTKMLTQELFQYSGGDVARTPSTTDQLTVTAYSRFPSALWDAIETCHRELCTVLHHDTDPDCDSNFVYISCAELSALDIFKYSCAFYEQTGKKPIVIVDYLQRLRSPSPDYTGSGADKCSIDENIHYLKDLAVSMSTIVLTLSSVAKSAFSKPDALDADEGSNQILHTADNLFVLCKRSSVKKDMAAVNPGRRELSLKLIKHRNGQLGDVPFDFYPSADFFRCADMPLDESRLIHQRYLTITALQQQAETPVLNAEDEELSLQEGGSHETV